MKLVDNVAGGGYQLLNVRLEQLAADVTPATSNKGQPWYNTASNLVKVSNGTTVDTLTNILESVSANGSTPNGLSVAGVAGKNQVISLALASGAAAGAMSTAHYSLVNGATAANTASALVQRDTSGNFSAGTITAALTGTASNASQLNNQSAAYYLSRSNHTGTQLAATISDFDTQVRTNRLDQMAAPTAAVSYNNQRITNVADPTSGTDAANKNYVDNIAAGYDPKASVRAATTAAISGATYNATGGTSGRGQFTTMPQVLDGVNLAVGNRVLVKNQANAAQNGIYVVTTLGTGANGVWDRATDFDQDSEVTSGAYTFVEEGTAGATTNWVLSTANPITIGGNSGTNLTFVQTGAGSTYTNGNGLNLSGNVFSVRPDTTSVNPNSLSVSGTGVTIATTYVGQASITTVGTITTGVWNGSAVPVANGGTGATTASAARSNLAAAGKFVKLLDTSAATYDVVHNLNSSDVSPTLREVSSGDIVAPTYKIIDANTIRVTFGTAPAANAYSLTVVG